MNILSRDQQIAAISALTEGCSRMASRRFTPLTNGFSKKLANHIAAVNLYVAHFNLYRVHEALRITPAMAMGITDHIWTIGELVDAATAAPMEQQRPSG